MMVLKVDDDIVLPYAKGAPFRFATLREHADRGRRARVVEDTHVSPRTLAHVELGLPAPTAMSVHDIALLEHMAAFTLGELAWLQGVPEGAEVRISKEGTMRCRVSAAHLDYHRAESASWAKKQRRAGYLPVLVVVGERVRTLGLPWPGPRTIVDLDEVRRLLPEFGVRRFSHVEVL